MLFRRHQHPSHGRNDIGMTAPFNPEIHPVKALNTNFYHIMEERVPCSILFLGSIVVRSISKQTRYLGWHVEYEYSSVYKSPDFVHRKHPCPPPFPLPVPLTKVQTNVGAQGMIALLAS